MNKIIYFFNHSRIHNGIFMGTIAKGCNDKDYENVSFYHGGEHEGTMAVQKKYIFETVDEAGLFYINWYKERFARKLKELKEPAEAYGSFREIFDKALEND